jgi:hypothetical protein
MYAWMEYKRTLNSGKNIILAVGIIVKVIWSAQYTNPNIYSIFSFDWFNNN